MKLDNSISDLLDSPSTNVTTSGINDTILMSEYRSKNLTYPDWEKSDESVTESNNIEKKYGIAKPYRKYIRGDLKSDQNK